MSDSNNPFLVPEDFFPEARKDILRGAARIRRIRISITAAVAALILLAVPAYLHRNRDTGENLYVEAADLYDYDIVLQILD
ncbi:MAG: hypothetical protein IKH49_00970 [Bacteroidales bacterium]|jgi:hypothetical protein|nr:hypothetical protein [Bacteroidales bacterium]